MPDIVFSLIDYAPMMAALAAAGIAAGFLSGLFGIGGGSVLVPVLYTAMGAAGVPEDIRMQVTLGTSFGVIGPTGYRSYRAHRARNAVDMKTLTRLGPAVFLGVVVGVAIASAMSSEALRWVWVVAAIVMSLKPAALVMLPTSIALAPVGVRLAHGLSKRALELAFAAFLALVAVKFLWSLYG